MVDVEALRRLAERLAREAGDLLLQGLQQNREAEGTKSSPTDLVTVWDRRSEDLIRSGLAATRPDDGVLGEEGGSSAGTSRVRWVVDPLDGTTNYLYGLPGFGVSIAAEVEGEVTVATVADPLHGELFSAVRGRGARRNGVPINGSDHADLATALLATGFSYEAERRRRQAQVLTQVLPCIRDIRRGGAAAVDLCWVACGRFDGFWERGLAPWDFAAGALIAAEAGAVVGDLDGGAPSSEFVMATAPRLHDDLRRLLHDAGAGHA
jgi:fructose-1,6-bisphosphatase/inositol monophosphatase family enzyme